MSAETAARQRTEVIQNDVGGKVSLSADYRTLTHTYANTAMAVDIAIYLSLSPLDDLLEAAVTVATMDEEPTP